MKIGDEVVIIRSDITAVNPGDKGKISCIKDGGFGVDIHKTWPQILSHQKSATETRTIYFERSQLK